MSSLAAARADNFYYPPDWRPEDGSISKYQGSKGANQFEQKGIIRFELPFDGWCLKCERHISKGTRYNAKKEEDGKYYTTKIWKFTMKCATCDNILIIKTNPAESTYDFSEGIRRMEQDYEPDYINDSVEKVNSIVDKQLLASDPIYKLQHDREDKVKADTARARIDNILTIKENFEDDCSHNSDLRKILRTKKKKDLALLKEGHAIGINIPLIDSLEMDAVYSSLEPYQPSSRRVASSYRRSEGLKLLEIQSASIFDKPKSSLTNGSKAPTTTTNATKKRPISSTVAALVPSALSSSSKRHKSSSSSSSQSVITSHRPSSHDSHLLQPSTAAGTATTTYSKHRQSTHSIQADRMKTALKTKLTKNIHVAIPTSSSHTHDTTLSNSNVRIATTHNKQEHKSETNKDRSSSGGVGEKGQNYDGGKDVLNMLASVYDSD